MWGPPPAGQYGSVSFPLALSLSAPNFCLMRGGHSLLLSSLASGAARLNHTPKNWALVPASLHGAGRSCGAFLRGLWLEMVWLGCSSRFPGS